VIEFGCHGNKRVLNSWYEYLSMFTVVV